jgi:serine/threonine-protein kinase HipA
MIKVWTDGAEAGLLDRDGVRGSTFLYLPDTQPKRAVSVTMAVRLPSWNVRFGLPPIFEMNLPEGVLRERLRLAFAKATGTFDDFDLLAIVGRSQIGRIRSNAAATYSATLSTSLPHSPVSAACSPRSSCVTKMLRLP